MFDPPISVYCPVLKFGKMLPTNHLNQTFRARMRSKAPHDCQRDCLAMGDASQKFSQHVDEVTTWRPWHIFNPTRLHYVLLGNGRCKSQHFIKKPSRPNADRLQWHSLRLPVAVINETENAALCQRLSVHRSLSRPTS